MQNQTSSHSSKKGDYLLYIRNKPNYSRRVTELLSWGIVLTAVLALAGLGFAALQVQTSSDEFWIARGLFMLAAIAAAARLIYWGMTTTRSTALRFFVCVLACGLIAALAVEAIRYVNRKSARWAASNHAENISRQVGEKLFYETPGYDLTSTNPQAATDEANLQTIATSKPEPNIVLRWDDNDNYIRIARDPNQRRTFRESSGASRFNAVIVQFRNAPKPSHKLGRATNVTAEVLYYDTDHPEVIDLRTAGCWLNEPSPTISFDIDSPQYLILGVFYKFEGGCNFQVFDPSDPNEFCAMSGVGNMSYKIVVRLSWGEHREFGIEESFELTMEFGEHSKFFELFHLMEETDDNNRPIKRTRGRVRFV